MITNLRGMIDASLRDCLNGDSPLTECMLGMHVPYVA